MAQRVLVDALLDLAARPEASPEVRSLTLAELRRFRRLISARPGRDPEEAAHLRLAERDVAEFLDHPEVRKARPPRLPAPPGRPIGAGSDFY